MTDPVTRATEELKAGLDPALIPAVADIGHPHDAVPVQTPVDGLRDIPSRREGHFGANDCARTLPVRADLSEVPL